MANLQTYRFFICSQCDFDTHNDVEIDVDIMCRQIFIARLRPETRERFDSQDGVYALANWCLWDSWDDDEFEPLAEDESVEDASDDEFGYYITDKNTGKEVFEHIYTYYGKHNIEADNVEITGSGMTLFGEWLVEPQV
jgi:hypothetical protein